MAEKEERERDKEVEKTSLFKQIAFFLLSFCLLGFFFLLILSSFLSAVSLLLCLRSSWQIISIPYQNIFGYSTYTQPKREHTACGTFKCASTYYAPHALLRTRKVIRQSRMSRPKRFSFGNYYSAIHARTVHIKAMRQSQGDEDVNNCTNQKKPLNSAVLETTKQSSKEF